MFQGKNKSASIRADFNSFIIMRYSTDFVLLYLQYLVPIYSNADAVLTNWTCSVWGLLPKKQRSSEQGFPFIFSVVMTWPGLWQKHNLLSFPCWAFYLFHQSFRPSEGQQRRVSSWIQRTYCFAKWAQFVEIELCNRRCMTGDLMSRYVPNIRGGLTKFDSNHVLRMWIACLNLD